MTTPVGVPEGCVVHVLLYGQALCGLEGWPSQWPPNHLWVGILGRDGVDADKLANCPGCLESFKSQDVIDKIVARIKQQLGRMFNKKG